MIAVAISVPVYWSFPRDEDPSATPWEGKQWPGLQSPPKSGVLPRPEGEIMDSSRPDDRLIQRFLHRLHSRS
eukprot:scaffold6915_cov170-Amphora_coffeaeformis.AAC.13